ncbi:undecaprenyl-phosphate glucose phosphotransferase [Herpetosiphon sp.]|uniref:Undecaprenyl-phosphate galactose phosphotransferase n=1 Tax=Herpetosiphon aurantiacus (strain ATCC 23779 / DSM 785 / 114-95) TaxID=316274 RepID=A9B7R1_HERA2|nr:undecaprenyl-phosphate glucose phosphotransferase [Herpetosiphon sp.]ABX04439.1 Undecaprenyl-phosphate galactose phosphotransferase [Herpetosiphon aurantiacus DSM 785]
MATTTMLNQTTVVTRRYRYVVLLLLMGCDIIGVNGGFFLAYYLNLEAIVREFQPPSVGQVLLTLAVLNALFGTLFTANGLYRMQRGGSRIDEGYHIFRAISIGTIMFIALNTLFPIINITTLTLVYGWILATIGTTILRLIYHRAIGQLRLRGYDTRRVLIIGAGEIGQLVYRQMSKAPSLGYQIIGFLSDDVPTGQQVVDDVPVLGKRAKLGLAVRTCAIDEVIIALSGASYNDVFALISQVEDESVSIKIYPDAFQLITNNEVSVGELSGLPLITVRAVPLDRQLNRTVKRLLDIAVSAAALVMLAPLLLLIGILIKIDSPGPAFFIQERVGRDGRPFKMIKYRSMRLDAEKLGTWTTPNDDRRTRLGTFLRRFSIDELPQFINVLLGDMSVVGPRPEQPRYVAQFSEQIPRYMHRHREKAGITGWAQVNGLRGDTSIEERTRYDLYYIENWSPMFDIKIIIRTAYNAIRGDENAY